MNSSSFTSTGISDEIQSVIMTKNPIALFFGLGKLRSLFEDLADSLLSNIEKTYYQESTASFIDLIKDYKDRGFYKVMNAYYHDNGHFAIQKQHLDSYFEESYWQDVDFYFFVLEKHPEIHSKIELLLFLFNENLDQEYLAIQDQEKRREFLEKNGKIVGVAMTDFSEMKSFLAFFDFLVPFFGDFRNSSQYNSSKNWKLSNRRFIKELYLFSLLSGQTQNIQFWRKFFLDDAGLNRNILKLLDERKVLDCIDYLRGKLLRSNKYNLSISDSNIYQKNINECIKLQKAPVQEKIKFLIELHSNMGVNAAYREQFQNVLRRGLLYQNSINLVDSILGVGFLKRPVFYEVRRRSVSIDTEKYHFESLDEVRILVKLLESSVLLRFFRPFFIRKLSQVFNKETELYFFIKFVLTVHSSSTYNEYQELSRFFVSLESFEKKGIYGALLKFSQFGWVILAGALVMMIAPFGVFLSAIAYVCIYGLSKIIKQRFPELILASNFQLGSYFTFFAVVSLVLGCTIGLKDNTRIVYDNYKSLINASTMVTSETMHLLNLSVFKASGMESNSEKNIGGSTGESDNVFSRIDYIEGKDYQSIKK